MTTDLTRRGFIAGGLAAAGLLPAAARAETLAVSSPDGRLTITFHDEHGPAWSVDWRGRPVLLPGRLGLALDGCGFNDLRTVGSSRRSEDTSWRPVYGERSLIRDQYHELTVELADRSGKKLEIIFRAYDAGAAVGYRLPAPDGRARFTIRAEHTRFRFAADHLCYPVYWAQGIYSEARLSRVRPGCERPLTVKLGDQTWAAIAEARLVDYARMRLQPAPAEPHTLMPDLRGAVTATAPFASPWRVVMVADRPGGLLQNNDLILNLNDPCAIADPSWIKPGKVIRDITVTTAGSRACIDFAVARKLPYIEIDAGWYGNEGSWLADARKVNVDPRRSQGPLDLPGVLAYARERGIGVWLYANRRQLELRHEELFALYEKWGVVGVKFGFVQVGRQRWTAWLHRAVRSAADHRLLVDIHDEYRPTGYSRTYPNLLTQEGVRGNEEMPTAAQNLVLPFTRFLAGAADATICWQDPRKKTSYAHQLAASVVFYSPLQFLYWYDRPAQVVVQPALDFWDRLPTVWDDTRVTQGEVGKFVTVARRSGDEWFVGTMNGGEPRDLEVRLDFLDPARKYQAFVYDDRAGTAGADNNPTEFVTTTIVPADSTTVLRAACSDSGGQAVRLEPAP